MVARAYTAVTAERIEEVTVELGPRSYQVLVGSALLPLVGPRLAALGHRGRCALVTSERVGALYRTPVEASLRGAGFDPIVVELADGEEHKTLGTLERLYGALLEAGFERQHERQRRCGERRERGAAKIGGDHLRRRQIAL